MPPQNSPSFERGRPDVADEERMLDSEDQRLLIIEDIDVLTLERLLCSDDEVFEEEEPSSDTTRRRVALTTVPFRRTSVVPRTSVEPFVYVTIAVSSSCHSMDFTRRLDEAVPAGVIEDRFALM